MRWIRPRPYRREVTERLWVGDEATGKVERSPGASPKWITRPSKLTGAPERVQVDEISDVPAAWHYLPSSVVLRLVDYMRRDGGGDG